MRKLTAKELDEITSALAEGRMWTVEVEDFSMAEFGEQSANRQSRRANGDDDEKDDANADETVEVGRRPARSS